MRRLMPTSAAALVLTTGTALLLAACGSTESRPVAPAPAEPASISSTPAFSSAPAKSTPTSVPPTEIPPIPATPASSTSAAVAPRAFDANAKTAMDQGSSEEDTAITQAVRRAVVADNTLSVRGQNVIIITADRSVTLRGMVASAVERQAITELAKKTPGVSMVYDQMQVAEP